MVRRQPALLSRFGVDHFKPEKSGRMNINA
jgi:hypothetical protein